MAVQLQRDPFARASFMREQSGHGTCEWCGQRGRLFEYLWEDDAAPHRHWPPVKAHRFCAVGCYRAYMS